MSVLENIRKDVDNGRHPGEPLESKELTYACARLLGTNPRRQTEREPAVGQAETAQYETQNIKEAIMRQAEATLFHEDDQVRVTRWSFTAAGDTTGEHQHEYRYIVVPVTGGSLHIIGADGTPGRMEQLAGEPYNGAAGTLHTVTSESDQLIAFIEVELKNPPTA
jgi:hypothetical protein